MAVTTLACAALSGRAEEPAPPTGVLAQVGDRPIEAAALERAIAQQAEVLWFTRLNAQAVYRFKLRNLQTDTLRKLIDDQVVAAELGRGGRTEAEVRAALEAEGGRTALWRSHGVRTLWQPRVEIDLEGAPALGPASAPVTVVEFGDFTCGLCARFAPVMRQVRERYGERVRFVFRLYPLGVSGDEAFRSAQIAACAQEQGKFWEVHDLLFREGEQILAEGVDSVIPDLPVDATKLRGCLASAHSGERVKREQELGARAGVPGTPAVFVNGILRGGNQWLGGLSTLIEEELARLATRPPAQL